MMSLPPGALLRVAVFAAGTVALLPVQWLVMRLAPARATAIPRLFHRMTLRCLGVRRRVRGTPPPKGAAGLIVSNHVSWLDICVLGAERPLSFVAKSEVAGWPGFGFLARLQQTVFIERRARSSTARQRDDLKARLEAGDTLILFPEGTSSDGNRTLPFKTALFAVAGTRVDGRPVTVQPVSVTATRLDGLPMGFAYRPFYAWYGDMDLAPHLWQAFGAGGMEVVVEFHEPVTLDAFSSRKALAEHCHRAVSHGVARAVSGRYEVLSAAAAVVAPAEPVATESHPG